MSVSKQLAMNFSVHGIKFPIEVIDIIKSFAFDDRVIAFAKKNMKEIVRTIDRAIISRKNFYAYVDDSSESWEFRVCDVPNSQFLSIKNTNCRVCGEFEPTFNSKFVCSCTRDEYYSYYDDENDNDNDPWYWQY
jgi:hypothetical protein